MDKIVICPIDYEDLISFNYFFTVKMEGKSQFCKGPVCHLVPQHECKYFIFTQVLIQQGKLYKKWGLGPLWKDFCDNIHGDYFDVVDWQWKSISFVGTINKKSRRMQRNNAKI